MANDYFTESSVPSTGASLTSATIRNEFTAIGDGFDKLPTLTGNGSKIVAVNSGGTALEALTTTGTGSGVRATSPTLTTPTIGVATATSINKVAITAPATSATLTIADGKTLTSSNTLTLAGTDGKTLTLSNTLTLAGTDGSTLNVGTGGTLGAAALLAGAGTTYTPTLTNTSGCSGASLNTAVYIRLESVVFVAVHISLTVNGGAAAVDFTIPVASNFSSSTHGMGMCWSNGDLGSISADTSNDRLQANWTATAGASTTAIFLAAYRII